MKAIFKAALAGALVSFAVPVIAGDATAGEAAYNGKGCSGCHGPGGKSAAPSNPPLAGMPAVAFTQAMADYKSGTRKNGTMQAMSSMLSDADVANMGAYLSAQ
ncbi:MAG: cytochrome c [Chromatiales bacterium]|nr:cytochrome c [Chromatiales bacterium]